MMSNIESSRLHLPLHLKWSGPCEYDMSDPAQRKLVYEIILREGRTADIRAYIDLAELRRLFDSLFLPEHVHAAWEDYLHQRYRGTEVATVIREGGEGTYITLSSLQIRLAILFLSLPEAANFALAGGAALAFHRIIQRTTRDLDFFGTLAEEVQPVAESFAKQLRAEGFLAEPIGSSPVFVRLLVRDEGGEEVLVDIGMDYRLRPPEETGIGRVLSTEELAADKLLALFGRAEARDFVDVFLLARRFGTPAMLEWAGEKDKGFDPYRLALSMGRLESIPRGEFEVNDAVFQEMLICYRRLCAELIERATKP